MATDPQKYNLNHTMLRVKDPQRSISYYEFLGMKMIQKIENPGGQRFDAYFLGYDSPKSVSTGKTLGNRQGLIELHWHYDTPKDDSFNFNNGNSDPGKGFGHICISVDNIQAACQRIEDAGYKFQKKLSDGRMHHIAFALDPDGYWVELISFNSVDKTENEKSTDTGTYRMNHSMIRVKDPGISIEFYESVLGLKLLRTVENPSAGFNLYFLGYSNLIGEVKDAKGGGNPIADREGLLEMTWNYGTEKDESFAYHSGNEDPKGFGHLGFRVDNLEAACARLEEKGVKWQKRLSDGSVHILAFAKDPDGYWFEILQNEALQT